MAIVALWAAVLIPMWLRRHDDDQARRIERHRVAMGTLARMSDEAEAAPAAASRRRRVVVACTATIGALGSAAWVAGLIPGVATVALWLPCALFLPVALILERRHARAAATRALAERREERIARQSRSLPEPIDAIWSEPVSRPQSGHASAVGFDIPDQRSVPWDEIFDQTA